MVRGIVASMDIAMVKVIVQLRVCKIRLINTPEVVHSLSQLLVKVMQIAMVTNTVVDKMENV